MVRARAVGVAFGLLMAVGFSSGLRAQENRCATCHFQIAATADGPRQRAEQAHLDEWDTSTHAGSDVSCDACHRGDPNTTELADAHHDVLSSANPASPVYPVISPRPVAPAMSNNWMPSERVDTMSCWWTVIGVRPRV